MVSFFNTGFLLYYYRLCRSQRRAAAAVGRGGTRGVAVRAGTEKMAQEYSNATVGGGVEDMYGEDRATEEQLVTPWTFSVASGYSLLRDPHYNKELAFTEKERDAHYLRGLLPPVVVTQELQERKFLQTLRQYTVPLQRYMAMMDLQASALLQNFFILSNGMNFNASMLVHLTLMLSQSSGVK
ncbi:hypothetical protein ZIOFF_039739 [Zingiber officinale]|uniref:Uncharacterized protein n=1 Tax=Zingiber officinale TaxID=94328 RepID=A0A8J5G1P8_ZINOF|nr:hypothetical protein ZIOFF_039739 [Zingiber officinale]